MITQNLDATRIYADQLTQGDILRHFTGDVWQVISEPKYVPKYVSNGISFEVLCLDVETPPNIQQVIFAAGCKFELLDRQPLMAAYEYIAIALSNECDYGSVGKSP